MLLFKKKKTYSEKVSTMKTHSQGKGDINSKTEEEPSSSQEEYKTQSLTTSSNKKE